MQLRSIQQNFFQQMLNRSSCCAHTKIYANNYLMGMTKALKATYPATLNLVGEKFFNALCVKHIKKNPSLTSNLDDYGENFDKTASAIPAKYSLPYLQDIITLEWCIHRCWIGLDCESLHISELTKAGDYDNLILAPLGNSYLLSTEYPIDDIWESSKPNPDINPEYVKIFLNTVYLYVWRTGYNLKISRLTNKEYKLMQILRSRLCLAKIYEHKPEYIEQIPELIQKGYIDKCFSLQS